jgi:hypothetical protein
VSDESGGESHRSFVCSVLAMACAWVAMGAHGIYVWFCAWWHFACMKNAVCTNHANHAQHTCSEWCCATEVRNNMLDLNIHHSATIGAHTLVCAFTDRDEPQFITVARYSIAPSQSMIDAGEHNDAEALLHCANTEVVDSEHFNNHTAATLFYCDMLTMACAEEIEALSEPV